MGVLAGRHIEPLAGNPEKNIMQTTFRWGAAGSHHQYHGGFSQEALPLHGEFFEQQ